MRATIVAATLIAVLLLGFTYYAQTRSDDRTTLEAGKSLQAYRQAQSEDVRQESGCFRIPDTYLDGGKVLLNQCTGDTWRFDTGYEYSESAYVRPYKWIAVPRD